VAGGDDALWAAIADPSRRRMLDLLVAGGQATPTTLAAALPLTRQAIAKHLAVLERADIVQGQHHGREVRYVVRPDGLDAAAQAMSGVSARWDRRLNAIKQLAESAYRDAASVAAGGTK
jgi:DNA-binding transcriptional ArsR family regulator